MNSKEWRNKALSLCLVVATIATYSMVALAGSAKVAGELTVRGTNTHGVSVNGEKAQTGRTIFSSSVVETSDNASATINLGEFGAIELAPGSNMLVAFTENGITGELVSGSVLVLSSKNAVSVKLSNGETVLLNAGETGTAGVSRAQDDNAAGSGGAAWWIWAAIFRRSNRRRCNCSN